MAHCVCHIELDTTAPQVTWGTPTGGAPGELLTVPYTIDEPEIVSAYLVDSYGRVFPLTVGASDLSAVMPADQIAGTAQIRATAKDDVDNQQIYTLELELTGRTLERRDEASGGQPFTHIGGPAFEHQTDSFEAYVQGVSLDVTRASGLVSGRRPVTTEEFAATVSAARREEVRFSAERQGNVTLAQIRREDDELMALI